jgi:hypothetical protein
MRWVMGWLSSLTKDPVETAKQEAHERAVALGLFEDVKVVALTGRFEDGVCEVEWEGCVVRYADNNQIDAMVTKPGGLVLYHAVQIHRSPGSEHGTEIFRFGPWVERFKAKADSIRSQQQAAIVAEQKAKLDKDLEPYSDVDF